MAIVRWLCRTVVQCFLVVWALFIIGLVLTVVLLGVDLLTDIVLNF